MAMRITIQIALENRHKGRDIHKDADVEHHCISIVSFTSIKQHSGVKAQRSLPPN